MNNKILLSSVQLGDLHLKNRLVVAPLTRVRADDNGIPTDMMIKHYTLRSQFGLIITEASSTSHNSKTFGNSGNIYTEEQMQGWKKVVDSVHQQGGLICLQIWHGGRTTNKIQIEGRDPVAPSPIAINGINRYTNLSYDVPHELSIQEIKEVVEEFRKGAINAKNAGFDAIQLHGANSYLVDEFLKDSSNKRTDEYGGSIPNRCRFALEVIDVLISVFGAGRVSVRFSPTGRTNDMYDSNPLELMTYLLFELDKRNIAFVEIKRYNPFDVQINKSHQISPEIQIPDFFKTLRKLYKGNIIGNDSITLTEAETLVQEKTVEAVSFGMLSIFNPDLVQRYTNDWPLNNSTDRTYFYVGGEKLYLDVPLYQDDKKAENGENQVITP
ncbi:hypothetical protein ABPG72_001415 [Tetrahymena utriculariae]